MMFEDFDLDYVEMDTEEMEALNLTAEQKADIWLQKAVHCTYQAHINCMDFEEGAVNPPKKTETQQAIYDAAGAIVEARKVLKKKAELLGNSLEPDVKVEDKTEGFSIS